MRGQGESQRFVLVSALDAWVDGWHTTEGKSGVSVFAASIAFVSFFFGELGDVTGFNWRKKKMHILDVTVYTLFWILDDRRMEFLFTEMNRKKWLV